MVIGAGPAGLFAAYELAKNSKLKVIVVDRGRDVDKRFCPAWETGECVNCDPCSIMCGLGGSGTLSDGLLNLRPDVGGNLFELVEDERKAWDLVNYVDRIFVEHGAPEDVYEGDKDAIEELSRRAAAAGIEFVPIRQRHIGSDNAPRVIKNLKLTLENLGVRFLLETKVLSIERGYVRTTKGEIRYRYLLVAPGRVGANWFAEQARKLGIELEHGPIDVGVRVEVPSVIFEPIIKINRDPKFHIRTKTYDDFVRTFCTNHRGFVVKETYEGFVGVNGHSYRNKFSDNTNFAFLVRIELTEPVEDTTAYGRRIAELATTIGGGKPLIQRLGDLRRGRRSTWERINRSLVKPTLRAVTPGDISMALPHRVVTDIIEGLEKLDRVLAGVASDSTLLYAPEIKFYAMKPAVNENLETNVENIFVAGDGAGMSRSIVIAAATGIIAARGILKKEGVAG